jgi:glycine oxidase
MQKLLYDVCIQGAGISGLMVAFWARKKGYRVCVLEQLQTQIFQASMASGGILCPLALHQTSKSLMPWYQESLKLYPQIFSDISKQPPTTLGFYSTGLFLPCIAQRQIDLIAWANNWDLLWQKNDGPAQDAGILLPEIGHIETPVFLNALKDYLKKIGVDFYQTKIDLLSKAQKNRLDYIEFDDLKITAEKFVLCTGAWFSEWLKKHEFGSWVYPVKGQILVYEIDVKNSEYASIKNKSYPIFLTTDLYLIPRKNNQFLVGSTLEFDQFKTTLNQEQTNQLMKKAQKLFPFLKPEYIQSSQWGFRPATANEQPFIGRVPNYENIWANVGHFRNGVCLAPSFSLSLVDQW